MVQTKTCSLTLVTVSKPSLSISETAPVEKSTIWMRCNVENGTKPILYVWQYKNNSGSITTFAQSNSNIVTMGNVNRSLTGLYRCVSSNFISSDSSDWLLLDIIFGPDVPQLVVAPSRLAELGYYALESETVSLSCQAQSNPTSQYIWFYNNSQVNTGSQYTVNKVLRSQTGEYTCMAQNPNMNARSKNSISLTVYYPPSGSPSCSVEAALNHTSLRLVCSWPGGSPSPSLLWTGDLIQAGQQTSLQSSSAVILLSSKILTSYSSLFTCVGSHPALKQQTECSTRSYVPPAEPVCFAYATNNQEYLMLSCTWDGGAPKALVWWEGPGGQNQGGQENSNILVLRYGTARSGNPYTCYAKHPLLLQPKTCSLTLEAPVLLTQRRVVSVYEGSDVQLTCSLRDNYLPVNEITWFNNQGISVQDRSKYLLLRTSAWANLTVKDTDEMHDSGEYRCSTSNAVGGADINVTLVVKKYPMPPNVTLVKVTYNSQQRNEVDLEWTVESQVDGGWTGFFLEHRWRSEKPNKRISRNDSQVPREERASSQDWYSNIVQDPDARTYTVRGLTPTVNYLFRVTPVNYRTIGHPSAAKTPVELHNNMYPAVVGAAVGGMLFAVIPIALFLLYALRNRDNNPRLHHLLFGSQHSQSRENINFPEDELVRGSEEGIEIPAGPTSSELKVSS
uniref:V-set and immunoglobulin domain containing 10 n=1 Tax=Iconisemion striatum TaxID=60296 RepID=A0A1A7XCW0_9TELE